MLKNDNFCWIAIALCFETKMKLQFYVITRFELINEWEFEINKQTKTTKIFLTCSYMLSKNINC